MSTFAWEMWGRTGRRATGNGSLSELLLEVPLEFPESGGWGTPQLAQIGDSSGTPPLFSPQVPICRGFEQGKIPLLCLQKLRENNEYRDGA